MDRFFVYLLLAFALGGGHILAQQTSPTTTTYQSGTSVSTMWLYNMTKTNDLYASIITAQIFYSIDCKNGLEGCHNLAAFTLLTGRGYNGPIITASGRRDFVTALTNADDSSLSTTTGGLVLFGPTKTYEVFSFACLGHQSFSRGDFGKRHWYWHCCRDDVRVQTIVSETITAIAASAVPVTITAGLEKPIGMKTNAAASVPAATVQAAAALAGVGMAALLGVVLS
ncbi:hypothetical protein B0H63DRAFT_455409 [Podospora didyma]|uniref:Uncharacterized protein n=1 Tax=Podospora didyma TaxID=330526 RepID=A0AAE0N2M9_9PEZI|nr:hypothetical protein B0H63DRAFT_455409 [Podospora didyma]